MPNYGKRKCKKCGEEFDAKYWNQKYCNRDHFPDITTNSKIHPFHIARDMKIKMFGLKCQLCGCALTAKRETSSKYVQIHHADGKRRNNSIWNLLIVCPSCHMNLHRRIESIEKYSRDYRCKLCRQRQSKYNK